MEKQSISERFNSAGTMTKAFLTACALAGVFAIFIAATWPKVDPNSSASIPSISVLPQTSRLNIETIVVRQDPEGHTNDDLSPAFLTAYENEFVKRTVQQGKKSVAVQGISPDEFKSDLIESSSWIMEVDGKRFGIIDMKVPRGRMKSIVSFHANQFVRVSCIDPSGAEVPTFSGPCAEKIHEVFGVTLPATGQT